MIRHESTSLWFSMNFNIRDTALKPMKLNLMFQTWDLLVFVAGFRKKNILWRTLAKSVEKIKVTKLKYLLTIGFNF